MNAVSRGCVLAGLLATVLPAPARAVEPPDAAARAALEHRIGHLGRVQIVGESDSTFILPGPSVRSDGLVMRRPWHPPRRALIEIDVPPPPAPPAFVPWSRISAIQVPGSDFRRGATAGAVVGACLVAATVFSLRHYVQDDWDQAAPAIWGGGAVVVGVCALAGGLLFGIESSSWRTVYPPRARRGP